MSIISRTAQFTHEGRTLEGLALSWDVPVSVSDDGQRTYLEEYDRSCCDQTLSGRPTRPLGIMHPWSPGARTSPIPLGAVDFKRSAEGLVFSAKVSRTVAGDEALELVRDGALGDVSISARPIRQSQRPSPRGMVVRRLEIALRELSLAPNGMGARPEAKVLVMRTEHDELDGTPRRDHVSSRLRALLL